VAGAPAAVHEHSQAREASRRVFFALWPDAAQRAGLAHAIRKPVRSCGGRPVPPENLHVTLAFLGSVPERRVPELHRIAFGLAETFPATAEPLSLRFDRLVHWKRPQILCALAGAAAMADEDSAGEGSRTENPERAEPSAPSSAARLATLLKEKTSAAGFTPDLKPFRPHVTLARKVVHAPTRCELSAVQWDFDAFALIESRTESAGPVYSVIESYLLGKREKAHE